MGDDGRFVICFVSMLWWVQWPIAVISGLLFSGGIVVWSTINAAKRVKNDFELKIFIMNMLAAFFVLMVILRRLYDAIMGLGG